MSAQLTDRELLEFAAKAAGYEVRWHEIWKCFVHVHPFNIDTPPTLAGQRLVWVPLQDGGDAFRLAVTLGIRIDSKYMMEVDEIIGCMQVAAVWLPHDSGEPSFHGFGGESTDSIIRGLIVRAAAEIGKAMP